MKHKKRAKHAGGGHAGAEERGAAAFAKKHKGFVAAAAIAVLAVIAFFCSFLVAGYSAYSPTLEQTELSKSLYEQNQQQLDDLISAANEQLNGSYQSTIEDDYFSSMRDDFQWLKAKETELYYAWPAQDAYARELAFTFFMQKVLAANEDSAYLFDPENLDSTIAAAQKVSAPVVSDLASLEDFSQAGLTEEDYNAITAGSQYVETRFLSAMNALINEYYSAKRLVIQGDSSQERKYVEAKKLMLVS